MAKMGTYYRNLLDENIDAIKEKVQSTGASWSDWYAGATGGKRLHPFTEQDRISSERLIDDVIKDIQRQKTAKQEKAISELSNFSQSYERENPFAYLRDNPYMKSVRREMSAQEQGAGAELGKILAARGTTDSGQATRNVARMKQQSARTLGQVAGQDYLRQFGDYQRKEAQIYNQKLAGYQLEQQMQERLKEEFYQKLAIKQQDALMQWQEEQRNNQNVWKAIAGGALLAGAGIITGGVGLAAMTPELIALVGGMGATGASTLGSIGG